MESCRIYRWAIVGILFFLTARAQGQDIKAWLEGQMKGKPDAIPISIEMDEEETSARSAVEVESRWREIEQYPEHPERGVLELQRRLIRMPESSKMELSIGPDKLWAYREENDSRKVRNGGSIDVRWSFGEFTSPAGRQAQLTIIHEGVPAPTMYNVSRLYDDARSLSSDLLFWSLSRLGSKAAIAAVSEVAGDHWNATLRGEGLSRYEIDGKVLGSEPWISRIQVFGASSDKSIATYEYKDPERHVALGRLLPKVFCSSNSISQKVYRIRSIRLINNPELIEAALPPKVEGSTVFDFSSTDSPAWNSYKGHSAMIWRHGKDGDEYLPVASDNVPASIPSTPAHQTSSYSFYTIARIAAAVFALIVLFGAARSRLFHQKGQV